MNRNTKTEALFYTASVLYFSFGYFFFTKKKEYAAYLSSKAATPGSTLPSINSKEAPPPVET